jgi:hypothetical protein
VSCWFPDKFSDKDSCAVDELVQCATTVLYSTAVPVAGSGTLEPLPWARRRASKNKRNPRQGTRHLDIGQNALPWAPAFSLNGRQDRQTHLNWARMNFEGSNLFTALGVRVLLVPLSSDPLNAPMPPALFERYAAEVRRNASADLQSLASFWFAADVDSDGIGAHHSNGGGGDGRCGVDAEPGATARAAPLPAFSSFSFTAQQGGGSAASPPSASAAPFASSASGAPAQRNWRDGRMWLDFVSVADAARNQEWEQLTCARRPVALIALLHCPRCVSFFMCLCFIHGEYMSKCLCLKL